MVTAVKFEDLLEEVGSFGLYQRLLCFILIPLTTGICGFTYYSQIFVLTAPPHFCKLQQTGSISLPGSESARALENTKNTIRSTNFSENGISDCFQYDHSEMASNSSILEQEKEPCTNGWTYEYGSIFPTLTSQNDWVCGESWRPYMIITFFWIGNVFGAWIFGVLSDKYGRRPVIAASISVYVASAVASSFASSFYLFTALRFLVGSAHHTVSHLPFVYVVEQCGVKNRVIPLLTIMMSYTIASILSPLLANLIWDWEILVLVSTVPAFLVLLFYRWLPESPSWLAAKGRTRESRETLKKIARINRTTLSEDALASFFEMTDEKPDLINAESGPTRNSIIEVLKFKRLRKNILVVLILWMLGCFCYYGHCQNTSLLGGSIFANYLFGALVEIPSWCGPWLIHRFGRKPPLSAAFLISGIAGIVYAFIPQEYSNVALGFALLGRMTITVAYYITLQYGPEIFPTVIRGQGVAISETMGGVAIFVSPLIVFLGEFQSYLPLLIFGGLSVVGAMGTALLPETARSALPQTMQQGEDFGKKDSAT